MAMDQILFILLTAIVAIFFVWRVKVDPLAVAFGACVIYFMPGLVGIAQFSYGQGLESYVQPIVPGAYAAMALVLVALGAVALVTDRVPTGPAIRIRFEARMPAVLLAFAVVAGAVSIHHVGVYYLCLDKAIILDKLDPWYYYASLSVPFCIAMAYSLRQWPIVVLGVLGLVAELYAGFRWATAISFLACAMLAGDWLQQGWRRIVAFAMILCVGGAALFVTKHLIVPAKYATGRYCEAQLALDAKLPAPPAAQNAPGSASQRPSAREAEDRTRRAAVEPLMSTSEKLRNTAANLSRWSFYASAFVSQSEAFVIQSILNEVVRKDFHTDAAYLKGHILTGLPLGATVFGIDSSRIKTFNVMMQPALFPGVTFGMANNPWAQAYAAGGLWMVAVFAFGYAAIMGILSYFFATTTGSLRAAVAVTGAWIGFYFHRNDLFIEAVLIKHVVYICGAAILVAWAWDWLSQVVKRLQRGRVTQ